MKDFILVRNFAVPKLREDIHFPLQVALTDSSQFIVSGSDHANAYVFNRKGMIVDVLKHGAKRQRIQVIGVRIYSSSSSRPTDIPYRISWSMQDKKQMQWKDIAI